MNELVSIIIPIYNSERYINHCLSSIREQTYKNIEIIIINDGSTDNSLNICKQIQEQDNRIIIINQENKGASMARLEGIKKAHGKYLTFIDSDDVIDLAYIDLLLKAIYKEETYIAACNIVKHKMNNQIIAPSYTNKSRIINEQELLKRFFKYEFWGFPGKLYKKNIFENIYFPKATINEDYVVMVQLFDKYKKIAHIDIALYHYIIHTNESLSNTQLSLRMMDEWTNKLWSYQYYQLNAPKWEKHAEAQVAETCCKLIAAIGNNKDYYVYKKKMQSFLKHHFFSLLFNQHLVKGIKLVMGYRILQ